MKKEVLKKDFILLNVGHAVHNADWNWKNVQSPFIRLHFVKKGSAKIIRDDGVYTLRQNHIYLTPSYVKHTYECDGELELFYIHLYENQGKELSIVDLVEFPVETTSLPIDISLIERLIDINPGRELTYYDPKTYDDASTVARNIAFQQKSPLAYEMETQGIIKLLISRFLAHATYKNEHVEERILKCLRHIHKNIDTPIDIEDLAEICHLTKDHFIRLFKKEMRCTPGKYINRKKIETAQLHILIENTTINEIAFRLGFDNISYFNRLFSKITGETPGRYRKIMRS